jgi:hypothetical protein
MKNVLPLTIALTVVAAMAPVSSIQGYEDEFWGENYESPMGFEITHVELQQIKCTHDHSGGSMDQAVPGMFMDDAFTTMVGSPFDENYSFSGGGSASVNHVVRFCVVSVREVCFAWAWQPCGHGVIFPPMPLLKGTVYDGERFCLEVPPGCYDISTTVTGFDVGEWDWIAMANYDGVGPIHPLSPDTDTFGGSKNSLVLYDIGDGIGHGLSAGRPWCVQVNP